MKTNLFGPRGTAKGGLNRARIGKGDVFLNRRATLTFQEKCDRAIGSSFLSGYLQRRGYEIRSYPLF